DAIAALGAGALDDKCGHAVSHGADFATRVALLLGEEALTVGDDEAEIPGAGLVDAGIIDLVEDAVADREPNPAPRFESRADAALGTRCPAGGNAGSARRWILEGHRAQIGPGSPWARGNTKRSIAWAKPSSSFVRVTALAARFTSALAFPMAIE